MRLLLAEVIRPPVPKEEEHSFSSLFRLSSQSLSAAPHPLLLLLAAIITLLVPR
jgi:hypothetical protein